MLVLDLGSIGRGYCCCSIHQQDGGERRQRTGDHRREPIRRPPRQRHQRVEVYNHDSLYFSLISNLQRYITRFGDLNYFPIADKQLRSIGWHLPLSDVVSETQQQTQHSSNQKISAVDYVRPLHDKEDIWTGTLYLLRHRR